MRNNRFASLIPVLVLIATGCATKTYVQEVVGQTSAKLGEKIGEQGRRIEQDARRVDAQAGRLDEQTAQIEAQASRVNAQGKRVEEMGERFARIETSVDELGNIARAASGKADEAHARAEEVNNRVSRLLASRYQRKLVETIHVLFGPDRADLTDAAQTALATLIKELAENPALVVDLEGYSDSRGKADRNMQLSERRVGAVRRLLVQHGIELSRINWIGLGELADKGSEADRAKNRRVTVRLLLPADDMSPQRSSSRTPGPETGARRSGEAVAGEAAAPQPASDAPAR